MAGKRIIRMQNVYIKYAAIFVIVLIMLGAAFFYEIKNFITGEAPQEIALNITIGGINAPNITYVSNFSEVIDIIADDNPYATNIEFNFSVRDSDGVGNVNASSAVLNITNGSLSIQNISCINRVNGSLIEMNFSCTLNIRYFYPNGSWNINAYIKDFNGYAGANTTTNFSIGSTLSFDSWPPSITFPPIPPGATLKKSSNDPIYLNNTGNVPIALGNIHVNATDLVGETDAGYRIYAGNFSVTADDFCSKNNLTRGINKSIPGVEMPSGDHSLLSSPRLYVCLNHAGSEISVQAYSTSGSSSEGSWIISIR